MKMHEENISDVRTENVSVEFKSNHCTHLRNKYTEDINSDTVTNKLADLIIHLEKNEPEPAQKYTDEEDICYSDDEDASLTDYDEKEDEIMRKVSESRSNIDDKETIRFTSETVRKIFLSIVSFFCPFNAKV